jgi:glycogen debranching enzyme
MTQSITLSRAECAHFENAIQREWLVTNGLGGYAAGTISGTNTRRYHGLLVAALRPPVGRTMLVAKIDTIASYGDQTYPLFSNEFAGDIVDSHGYRFLETFYLDGLIPTWVYALAEARLEQRLWLAHGHNTTYLTYTLSRGSGPLNLQLTPLCTYRDYHSHSHGGWSLGVETRPGGVEINAFAGAQPYRVLMDRGDFSLSKDWYWNFKHRLERYRGLDDTEDLFVPGHFAATLQPGESLTVICSTESLEPHSGLAALDQERQRQAGLLPATFSSEPAWIKQLVLAADQFLVQRSLTPAAADTATPSSSSSMHHALRTTRPSPTIKPKSRVTASTQPETGQTVIAGYPWFSDWGRDTMIALPGLTLSAQRPQLAATILRTFAQFVDQGMLPNRFPDAGETPEYNTVDATLWYFQAIHHYLRHTGDVALIKALYPVLGEIIDWHEKGTRYNIHVDPTDGLLYAGQPGVQLTWMDAKVGDWVVTPRQGKAVEINALWYNALRVMADLSKQLRNAEAARQYEAQAARVAEEFRRRFWFAKGGYLYDVIDGPELPIDASLRPNQIFAVSLPFPLLDGLQAKAVVEVCARHLFTPVGLRSLAPGQRAYSGHYGGGQYQRDGAYHQGTVWGWLLGPFALAHYQVYGDAVLARSFLSGVAHHLEEGCLGSISEIFDGEAPHAPRGCFAQAWSVAEVLRAWQELRE